MLPESDVCPLFVRVLAPEIPIELIDGVLLWSIFTFLGILSGIKYLVIEYMDSSANLTFLFGFESLDVIQAFKHHCHHHHHRHHDRHQYVSVPPPMNSGAGAGELNSALWLLHPPSHH